MMIDDDVDDDVDDWCIVLIDINDEWWRYSQQTGFGFIFGFAIY